MVLLLSFRYKYYNHRMVSKFELDAVEPSNEVAWRRPWGPFHPLFFFKSGLDDGEMCSMA